MHIPRAGAETEKRKKLNQKIYKMKKNLLLGLMIFASVSCKKQPTESVLVQEMATPKLETKAYFCDRLGTPYPIDANGYYRASLDRLQDYQNYAIFVEASTVTDKRYRPNGGVPYVIAKFKSDAYWVIKGKIKIDELTYSPLGNWVYSGGKYKPLPVGKSDLRELSQFAGTKVYIVPETGVRLDSTVNSREWSAKPGKLWSKRYVGPVLNGFYGDTVVIYGETKWDLGQLTYDNPESSVRRDTIKVIFRD